MKKKQYEGDELYKYMIISPLISEVIPRGELKKRIREVADKSYEHPERGWEKFAPKTIEEWFYKWRKHGLSALTRRNRSDSGQSRSISMELSELIVKMKQENPKRTASRILTELVMAGKITPGEISRTSIYRLFNVRQREILTYQKEKDDIKKFAFEFSNECWQCDVCHGPYLNVEGFNKKKKIFIYGFLDDASRVVPHMGIALSENMEHFLEVFKTAIMKRGIPGRLYTDNASYFKNPTVLRIGARLGIKVMYCTPYSPNQKGKIERFFRTMRDQFLSCLNKDDKYTLDRLNQLMLLWIEQDYHHRTHSSLGKSPLTAWLEKGVRVRFPDTENIDKDFLSEKKRLVRKDGTFSLNSTFYEVDSVYAGKKVNVRYNPFKVDKVFIYLDDQLIGEAFPVDEVENRKTSRQKYEDKPAPPVTGINYLDLLEKKATEEKNV